MQYRVIEFRLVRHQTNYMKRFCMLCIIIWMLHNTLELISVHGATYLSDLVGLVLQIVLKSGNLQVYAEVMCLVI